MKVSIPTPLRSYTGNQSVVEAKGATVGAILYEINQHHPGFRFRIIDEQGVIRQHIKLFINEKQVHDLSAATQPADAIHIICALSGG